MCNLSLLLGLVIAAECAFLVAVGFVGAAVATSSNIFTSGGSSVLLGIAIGGLALALAGVSAAAVNLGPCSGPSGCGVFGTRAQNLAIALSLVLTGFAALQIASVPCLGANC